MNEYILETKNIYKIFPGVIALKNVDFNVKRGEVLALVGENGAGKSTLIKVLNGNYQPDGGEVFFDGKKISIPSPAFARELGIAVISQELNLVPTLTVAENMYLGYLPKKNGRVDWKTIYSKAQAILDRIHCKVSPKATIDSISVAEQQMVEIARALTSDAKIILMDEPSSSLSDRELNELYTLIRQLKKDGVTIIYISHRMEEIFEVCDRVTIMRDGETVASSDISAIDRNEIVAQMVGREISDIYPPRGNSSGEELLSVELTAKEYVRDIKFTLHKGEILGVAGLVGAGRTEMAKALFGVDYVESMKILREGKEITIKAPRDAIRNKMAFLTEDRRNEGLLLNHPVSMNISMTNFGSISENGLASAKKEKRLAEKYVETLNIKTPSINQLSMNLSGGNQQKVVLSKWLNLDAEIYILDEPTRGIDIGAKREIYQLMRTLASEGKGIIFISSELSELIGMSDRMIVMRDGTISGTLDKDEISAEAIMHLAV